MCYAQRLNLNGNQIGDASVTALAGACASGSLAQLSDLYLSGNSISDKAKGTMRTNYHVQEKRRRSLLSAEIAISQRLPNMVITYVCVLCAAVTCDTTAGIEQCSVVC